MKQVSMIAQAVHPSSTMAVDAMAKQMKADGYDVMGFGAGEPDFDTPENISRAGIEAIMQGKTKYTPAAGIVQLRKTIVNQLKNDTGADFDYTQVVVASGAKHCVYIALKVLTNPGDEIILPAPYWVSYYEMIEMTGGTPVVIEAGEDQNFKITPEQLEAAITDKTKCFLLNNPSNPTGMVYSKEELEALTDICVKHDLYIISDEIYHHLVYKDIEFTSVVSLGEEVKERTLLINGVSKSYAMTGWRIGYCVANKQISKIMANYISHSTGAPCTISQIAAIEAIGGPQENIVDMRKAFDERRQHIVERINAIDGISCLDPDGAFYVMMNIENLIGKTIGGKLIESADDFAVTFLEKALVAVVPCTGFGIKNFVRWSYAVSMETIDEGIDRLEKFLAE